MMELYKRLQHGLRTTPDHMETRVRFVYAKNPLLDVDIEFGHDMKMGYHCGKDSKTWNSMRGSLTTQVVYIDNVVYFHVEFHAQGCKSCNQWCTPVKLFDLDCEIYARRLKRLAVEELVLKLKPTEKTEKKVGEKSNMKADHDATRCQACINRVPGHRLEDGETGEGKPRSMFEMGRGKSRLMFGPCEIRM